MRLGLYSELARAGRRGWPRIRRGAAATTRRPKASAAAARTSLKARDPRLRAIFGSPDFYSISACRDLLFHVQEHRLTLPQIAAFPAEHRLSFLGFELDAPALARIPGQFPAKTPP